MKPWFTEGSALFCVVALLCGGAARDSRVETFEAIDADIESLFLHEASEKLRILPKAQHGSAQGRYLVGKRLFFEGKYGQSREVLMEAIELARGELDWKILRDRVTASMEIHDKATAVTGRNDRFEFIYQHPLDALLVSYGDDALNRQREALSQLFSDIPEGPTRVYILSSVDSFARMCGISAEQIEATATVAMSRYNRIMILSPRIVSGGYPWLDTLAHELTHVTVTRLSRSRAPIWFQEGVAKLYEGLWRNEKQIDMSPEEAYLLDRAAREHRLIPFRRFHPSIAFLPSQEDAALAYAQVLSFMRYINTQSADPAWIRLSLLALGTGGDMDDLLTKFTRSSSRRLYGWWEQEAVGRRNTPSEIIPLMEKRFSTGTGAREIPDDDLYTASVRRHIRIGDLLRLRGHAREAVIEYERALELNEVAVPDITDRLAGCFIDMSQFDQAIDLLSPLLRLYPFHATLHFQLGSARRHQGKSAEALQAFRETISVDPFHPDVHCELQTLYRETGSPSEAGLEEANCRLTRRESDPTSLK